MSARDDAPDVTVSLGVAGSLHCSYGVLGQAIFPLLQYHRPIMARAGYLGMSGLGKRPGSIALTLLSLSPKWNKGKIQPVPSENLGHQKNI
ncbi:hypothetical protein BDV32DRAFT_74066 [Aspergillus pseudonomiae]|nr:hypothetical protein BDV32DRAFT_74066 [Aspergillus pseudonomiae]